MDLYLAYYAFSHLRARHLVPKAEDRRAKTMRYNIDKYIEVYSRHTSTSKADYPFSQWEGEWDKEKRPIIITDDDLYSQVKNAIKSITEENSEAYEQLFVAFKFYYQEAEEYNGYTTPPSEKSNYKNAISLIGELHREGKKALTAIDDKKGSKIIVRTSNERIIYIGVQTPDKTYKVPDYYFRLAEFDAESKNLSYIYKSSRGEYEQGEIKEWLRGVLELHLTDAIKGSNKRNNYEERFFKRLGGLYRWLMDNQLTNKEYTTIEFIKQLFNLKYADYGKIVQYITKEKCIIPKRQ